MNPQTAPPLSELYETDETAWLEAMSDLIAQGRLDELDYEHLRKYLSDMAIRNCREVKSRMVVLMMHLLKWEHQPAERSGSWRSTIILQGNEFADLARTGVLRNHAENALPDAYRRAVKAASADTGLPPSTSPANCPFTVDDLLNADVPAE